MAQEALRRPRASALADLGKEDAGMPELRRGDLPGAIRHHDRARDRWRAGPLPAVLNDHPD